jgi:hypothetical protein
MAEQCNVPTYPEDHDCFKQLAAKKKKSMKDLFHDWIIEEKAEEIKK